MATFVLIHGVADVGWYWHLVEEELRRQCHEVVAPDLPCDDDAAGLAEYADTVVAAIGDRSDLVVVGQSFGGFTATLVADRLPVDILGLVTGMIPAPGEKADDWFTNTGWAAAVQEQARRDGGLTGSDDPFVVFYHDVPRGLAEEALSKERYQSPTPGRSPWPLDTWPAVPTRFVLCSEDHFFPPAFMRRIVAERLALTPTRPLRRPQPLDGTGPHARRLREHEAASLRAGVGRDPDACSMLVFRVDARRHVGDDARQRDARQAVSHACSAAHGRLPGLNPSNSSFNACDACSRDTHNGPRPVGRGRYVGRPSQGGFRGTAQPLLPGSMAGRALVSDLGWLRQAART